MDDLSASDIRATLSPDFDHSSITVSFANRTASPIEISTVLKDTFPPENYVNPQWVYVCLVFTRHRGQIINFSNDESDSMIFLGGEVQPPVEIPAGQTKELKFSLPKYLIKIEKSTSEFKLILVRGNTTIDTMVYNKIEKA